MGEEFSLVSATRPRNLAVLGRRRVAELGTATAWTAISLVLADRRWVVVSYDPFEHPGRESYLRLVSPAARRQLAFVQAAGADGPHENRNVELLYIDSSHGLEETIRESQAWQPVLEDEAFVVFDDFIHPDYPGYGARSSS